MRGDHSFSEPPAGSVTCMSCGRVSMGMTRAEAEAAAARVNAGLRPGEHPVEVSYFRCCRAPRYRPARIGDIPDGASYGSVLAEGV
ncbi:hypothetical protein SAMN05216360_102474 [Methylobacterium phyllostachyos]|uniref:Uncharacterized protein n=1 Tax=Methylobacterium phyllostachyos TaxID=582672 RepID=A0A1G9UC52_9HYPH|nr:hypothetical protein [Methylobacterium phyllostachyos]SDM57135.1 hypothetical protein SAMN05216360_102474 [Methylobacterium phyllostachyos]